MATPTPLMLKREGDALAISWSDGKQSLIPWRTLRKACPCAACNEERSKPADPFRILSDRELAAGAPVPTLVIPKGRYAYQIFWNDGHDTGIYTLEFLYELASKQES